MNTLHIFNVFVTTEVHSKEQDKEKYISDMINIVGRPVLFIFGTIGEYC